MSKSSYDEPNISIPDWSDIVRIEQKARAYRSYGVTAASVRMMRRL